MKATQTDKLNESSKMARQIRVTNWWLSSVTDDTSQTMISTENIIHKNGESIAQIQIMWYIVTA